MILISPITALQLSCPPWMYPDKVISENFVFFCAKTIKQSEGTATDVDQPLTTFLFLQSNPNKFIKLIFKQQNADLSAVQ